MTARRLVTVAIPDMDGCERTLRYAARQLSILPHWAR
jgi:hypothetical protein